MIQILAYRSRLAIYHQTINRHIRKHAKDGRRFKTYINFAPASLRWGQLFRTYRLLWLIGKGGGGVNFTMLNFSFFMWLQGQTTLLRLAQSLQLVTMSQEKGKVVKTKAKAKGVKEVGCDYGGAMYNAGAGRGRRGG
jgi:hypothetical protein